MPRSRTATRIASILGAVLVLGWLYLGLRLESWINVVAPERLPEVGPRAEALHGTSFVADLHADSLLFGRDLLERGTMGHVDLPRLQEGGVALQVFSLPTVVPFGLNIEANTGDGLDSLTFAGAVQLSPTALLGPTGRALHAASRLQDFVAASDDEFVLIRTRADLAALQDARAAGADVTGALLAIEGAHALESDPENLGRLFDAGYRMIGLTHFFDNDYGGSAHGLERGGLTPLGRETIREMERLGITLDLAHLAPTAVDEALDLSTRPTVFSHGGVRGTCDNQRNLSDAHVRRIAEGGGVVGIGYWEWAVCGTSPGDVARALAYVVRLVGADHAGLGSDYDGGTTVGFDTSQLAALTQALLDEGLTEAQVRKVMGDNVLRVLAGNLPPAGRAADEAR
ncbi:MAG: dipeptidase [Myxococcota bacterium]